MREKEAFEANHKLSSRTVSQQEGLISKLNEAQKDLELRLVCLSPPSPRFPLNSFIEPLAFDLQQASKSAELAETAKALESLTELENLQQEHDTLTNAYEYEKQRAVSVRSVLFTSTLILN